MGNRPWAQFQNGIRERSIDYRTLVTSNFNACHGFWNGKVTIWQQNTHHSLCPSICKQAQFFMISSKQSKLEDPVIQICEKIIIPFGS